MCAAERGQVTDRLGVIVSSQSLILLLNIRYIRWVILVEGSKLRLPEKCLSEMIPMIRSYKLWPAFRAELLICQARKTVGISSIFLDVCCDVTRFCPSRLRHPR